MISSSKAIAAFLLIIVVCIGMLSFRNEIRNEEDRAWVGHTYRVVDQLQTLHIDIVQAESGERGFMLTGQDRYLNTYATGAIHVDRDIKTLGDLTMDNPEQQRAMARLDQLIAGQLADLATGIEARKKSGLQAAVAPLAQEDGRELWMELIATHIAEMRQREMTLLRARLSTAAASAQKIKVTIVWGNALVMLILLAKGFVIHRETNRRNLAEQSLKHANERLERRTAELSEANIELESFAYSVAHDLRAPLRHIAGYSAVLAEDYASHFDAEGLRCLEKIGEGAGKMGRLVDDLLNLSRIGRQKLSIQDTALDSLLGQVIEESAAECAGREVEWRIGDLFRAECDPGLMKQVFVNLLSNALKYTRKQQHAVIQVGHIKQNDECVVFVRDNGVGFEMQYVGKLFGVFQRLHKTRDFEGTGVGLAIVQRIIRKHGGRIWAEAELDQGATFFFTIGSPEIDTLTQTELPLHQEEMHVARS